MLGIARYDEEDMAFSGALMAATTVTPSANDLRWAEMFLEVYRGGTKLPTGYSIAFPSNDYTDVRLQNLTIKRATEN